MKSERISSRQRVECFHTAIRGRFPCPRITANERWLAAVSHEIKNPLTAIKGAAEMIWHKPESRELAVRLSASILASVTSMQKIIEDLLDVSRIEAGQFPIESKWVDAESIGARVRESQSPLASAGGNELRVLLEGRIFCDADRVVQALVNLVGNAVKFTHEGTVSVRGRRLGDRYVVRVQDTGAGIAREKLPHIFDRFWQAGSAHRAAGTGLGLSIVKGIVESHGGSIEVSSEPGVGTCFEIEFPNA